MISWDARRGCLHHVIHCCAVGCDEWYATDAPDVERVSHWGWRYIGLQALCSHCALVLVLAARQSKGWLKGQARRMGVMLFAPGAWYEERERRELRAQAETRRAA